MNGPLRLFLSYANEINAVNLILVAEAITHSPLSLRGLSGALNEKEIVEETERTDLFRRWKVCNRFLRGRSRSLGYGYRTWPWTIKRYCAARHFPSGGSSMKYVRTIFVFF